MGRHRGSGRSGALSTELPAGIEERDGSHIVRLQGPRIIRRNLLIIGGLLLTGLGMVAVADAWFVLTGAVVAALFVIWELFRPPRVVLGPDRIAYDVASTRGPWELDADDLRDVREGAFTIELVRSQGLPLRIPTLGLPAETATWLLRALRSRVPTEDPVARLPGLRSADGLQVRTGSSAWGRAMSVLFGGGLVALPILLAYTSIAALLAAHTWLIAPTGVVCLLAALWLFRGAWRILQVPDVIRLGTRDLRLVQRGRVRRRIGLHEIASARWQLLQRRVRLDLKSGEIVNLPLRAQEIAAPEAERLAQAIDAAAAAASSHPANTESIDPRLADLARRARQSDS